METKRYLSRLLSMCVVGCASASIMNVGAESVDHLSAQAAASKHAVYKLDSFDKLRAKAKLLEKTGMRLTDIEVSHNPGGGKSYIGVWKPGSGTTIAVDAHGWTNFTNTWSGLSNHSLRLLDVERIEESGTMMHYALFGEGTDAYAMYSADWSGFVQYWNQASDSGLRLTDVDLINDGGQHNYLGTFRQGGGGHAFYSHSSLSVFLDKFNEFKAANMDLIDVSMVYDGPSSYQYVGVWRAGTGEGHLKLHTSWDAFKTEWAAQAEAGFALLDLDVSQSDDNHSFDYYIASYAPAPTPPSGNPDLPEMGQFLEERFQDSVNGMAYAISQNGQMAEAGATGFAQRTPDPNIAMTSEARSTIASVTKMLTAPLLLNLLEKNNLTLDSRVHPWLPAAWSKGPGFGASGTPHVTFRHLLTHTSGLKQEYDNVIKGTSNEGSWGTNWDKLAFVVNHGTTPGSSYAYENINYALMRVLIPALWLPQGGPTGPTTKQNSVPRYLDFMSQTVAENQGIHSIQCQAQPGFPESKMYKFEDFGMSGWSFVGDADDCGGHAVLNLSAQDMTNYWDAVRFNDDIISDTDRSFLRDALPRKYDPDEGGHAYGHAGGWYWNGRETTTCLLEFPNNINASIILNSDTDPYYDPCSSLVDAYESAF